MADVVTALGLPALSPIGEDGPLERSVDEVG